MALSLTRRILSACRGDGWTKADAADRCAAPRNGCLPSQASTSMAPVGMLDCFGMTDIGRVRERNEDQFSIADLTRSVANCQVISSLDDACEGEGIASANLLLVADGVGGNAGGERASRLAAEEAIEYLLCNHKLLDRHAACGGERVLEDLKSALVWAQQSIQLEAEVSPLNSHMGTTLTLAYLQWPAVYLAHVGDSRAYLYRSPDLIQITDDQTVAQLLADAGVIEAERVRSHPLQNVLGSLLCSDIRRLEPRVYMRELAPGDQLLLCTDGLTRRVPAQLIAEILDSTFTAEDACRELIDLANAAGGTDNTTVVLARFGHREAGNAPAAAFSTKAPVEIGR